MTHTATCQDDGHIDVDDDLRHRVGEKTESLPSLKSPAPRAIAARSSRIGSFVTLPELRWSALAVVLFLAGLLTKGVGAPAAVTWTLLAGCYAAGGWEPGLAGLNALRQKTLDVDILMIVAALVAAAIGQVVDGGLLIVIFASSGALEAVATKRTQDSVRALLNLAPEHATRLEPDGTERVVNTSTLAVADILAVRPGERIGADGKVIDGASDVDQASITGEPLPVTKTAGSDVFAGTLNGTGFLRVRVERAATDTVVARIVALVEDASATKAHLQLFIEKVEQRYSVAMVAATVGLFIVPLVLGEALQPALLRAMTFMIVASPCAVVLATMPPLLSAIANAGRHGVLVKSAVVMEQLGQTSLLAFDKTGTLTEGKPVVTTVLLAPGADYDADEVLLYAAAAERPSEHPLAAAVVSAAQARGLVVPEVTDFQSVPGRGVTAGVNGHRVAVGSPLLISSQPDAGATYAQLVTRLQASGLTAVVATIDNIPVGVLGLADRLRPGATATVTALRTLTGRTPVLLTGDNPSAANQIAEQVGITDVRSELLPHDKVMAVHDLQTDGSRVCLVGDGVNDAPALATAHLGIAMGRHGSDLALQTADVVIVRDELGTVPIVIDLSRRTKRIITQNLIFAGTVICTLVAVDLAGHLPLPLGVVGHEGSTVVVGLNGLRLLSRRAWIQPR